MWADFVKTNWAELILGKLRWARSIPVLGEWGKGANLCPNIKVCQWQRWKSKRVKPSWSLYYVTFGVNVKPVCAVELVLNFATDNAMDSLQEEMLQCNDGETGISTEVPLCTLLSRGSCNRLQLYPHWCQLQLQGSQPWPLGQVRLAGGAHTGQNISLPPPHRDRNWWVLISGGVVRKAPLLAKVA